MADYKIIPDANSGFTVQVVSDGVRHTMLGFDSEVKALEWVKADRVRTPAAKLQEEFSLTVGADD